MKTGADWNRDWKFSRVRRSPLQLGVWMILVVATSLSLPEESRAECGDFGLPEGTGIVEFTTGMGSICMEMFRDEAPATVQNFIDYLNRGDFDDTIVHRRSSGFVIQGGAFRSEGDLLSVVPSDSPVTNEPCTADIDIGGGNFICSERGNEVGTVAMARSSGVNSATNQWFINLADNRGAPAFLDTQNQGFTVFGKVLGDGMDIANAIDALSIMDSSGVFFLNDSL